MTISTNQVSCFMRWRRRQAAIGEPATIDQDDAGDKRPSPREGMHLLCATSSGSASLPIGVRQSRDIEFALGREPRPSPESG